MTWRSTEIWLSRRYCSTARISRDGALTTTIPDCGETTTLRPGPLPTIATSAVRNSAQ